MAKSKMKTKRVAAKRYKVTGTGRLMHRRQGLNHLLEKKTGKQKRRLATEGELTGADARNAQQLIPYK
jgi:large subunit ribosomal protein L35